MLFVNWTKQDCVPKYWSKDNHSQNHFIVSVHSHKYKIRSLCAVIDSIINLNGFILVYLYLLSVDSLQNKISAGSMSVYSHRFTHRSEWNLFSCLCAVFSRNPVPVLIRQYQFYAKKWIAVERNWRKDTSLPDVLSRCHPYNRYRIYVDKFKCFAKVGRGQNDDGPLSHSQSVPKCLRLVTVEIQIASNAKSILYKVGWGGGFLNFYIKSGKGPDNTGTMLFVVWTKQDCVPKYWSKDNHSQNHFIVSVHSHKYKIRSLCAVIDSIINLNGFILVYLYLLSVDSLQNKISAGSMSVYSHRFTHRSEWNLFSCLCAVFSRNPVPVLIRQYQFYAKKWIAVERNWRKDTSLPDVLSRCHPYNRYRIYVDKFKCFAKVGRGQDDDGPLSHSQSVPKCFVFGYSRNTDSNHSSLTTCLLVCRSETFVFLLLLFLLHVVFV